MEVCDWVCADCYAATQAILLIFALIAIVRIDSHPKG